MTNMTNKHAITISGVDLAVALVFAMCCELAQLPGDVICSSCIGVPICVDAVRSSIGALAILITTIDVRVIIILLPPLAVVGWMPMDRTDLACDVDVGCWATAIIAATTLATTSITAALDIITASTITAANITTSFIMTSTIFAVSSIITTATAIAITIAAATVLAAIILIAVATVTTVTAAPAIISMATSILLAAGSVGRRGEGLHSGGLREHVLSHVM
jgi:hypothetical protein